MALRQMQTEILQQLAGLSQTKERYRQRKVDMDLWRVPDTSFQPSGASEAFCKDSLKRLLMQTGEAAPSYAMDAKQRVYTFARAALAQEQALH